MILHHYIFDRITHLSWNKSNLGQVITIRPTSHVIKDKYVIERANSNMILPQVLTAKTSSIVFHLHLTDEEPDKHIKKPESLITILFRYSLSQTMYDSTANHGV